MACHYNLFDRSLLFHRWGFVIACLLSTISILFFTSLYAITGLIMIIQPFVQMIGGFLHPGKPMANMYFVLFSYSESPIGLCVGHRCSTCGKSDSVIQAQLLLRDLKIAQCKSAVSPHGWCLIPSSIRYKAPSSCGVHCPTHWHVPWCHSELWCVYAF